MYLRPHEPGPHSDMTLLSLLLADNHDWFDSFDTMDGRCIESQVIYALLTMSSSVCITMMMMLSRFNSIKV